MMQSIYFLLLSIFLMPYSVQADLDLGSDFSSGATVSAAEFNQKFSKIKKVTGQYKDSDLIGDWNCTSYKESIGAVDWSHEIANGGNGQVGNGYFYSNTGTVTFSETDSSTSMDSPKSWSASRDDVLNDNGDSSGTYTLFFNMIHFFVGTGQSISFTNRMEIEFVEQNTFFLTPHRNDNGYPNYVVCNKST